MKFQLPMLFPLIFPHLEVYDNEKNNSLIYSHSTPEQKRVYFCLLEIKPSECLKFNFIDNFFAFKTVGKRGCHPLLLATLFYKMSSLLWYSIYMNMRMLFFFVYLDEQATNK